MSLFCYTFAAAYSLCVMYTKICYSVWSGPTVCDSAEADNVSRVRVRGVQYSILICLFFVLNTECKKMHGMDSTQFTNANTSFF